MSFRFAICVIKLAVQVEILYDLSLDINLNVVETHWHRI